MPFVRFFPDFVSHIDSFNSLKGVAFFETLVQVLAEGMPGGKNGLINLLHSS